MRDPASQPAEPALAELPHGHPAQAFAALPAGDLVRKIQEAQRNPNAPDSEAALTAFYHRYGPALVTVAVRALGSLCDRSDLQEVVHDTILQFVDKSSDFAIDRAESDEACDRNLRAYLAQLATWRARDVGRLRRGLAVVPLDNETINRVADSGAQSETPDLAQTKSPRERDDVTNSVAA